MEYHTQLIASLTNSHNHMYCLRLVQNLGLNDCWIAAGFIRNHIWSEVSSNSNNGTYVFDVDVIYHDPHNPDKNNDIALEKILHAQNEKMEWSVKNQARMHRNNRDNQYKNCEDAMVHWPETATAIAVRLSPKAELEILAPFGLSDLYNLVVRPTPYFEQNKIEIFNQRRTQKEWDKYWPELRYE